MFLAGSIEVGDFSKSSVGGFFWKGRGSKQTNKQMYCTHLKVKEQFFNLEKEGREFQFEQRAKAGFLNPGAGWFTWIKEKESSSTSS